MEGWSRSGGSVPHLVVVCVELRRVSGLRVFVAKESRVVCCAEWPGCWRRVVLWGRCDIARTPLHSTPLHSTPLHSLHSLTPLTPLTPLTHSTHSLHSLTPLTHSTHSLHSLTPLTHSTHSLTHSTHSLHSLTPLTPHSLTHSLTVTRIPTLITSITSLDPNASRSLDILLIYLTHIVWGLLPG